MITNKDIEKLKDVFATKEDLKNFATKEDLANEVSKLSTKEDLDESEARTAFGFTDVQNQLSLLKEGQYKLEEGQKELKEGQIEIIETLKDFQQQMEGMNKNIVSVINELKEDHETTKNRVTKLEKLAFSN